MQELRRKQQNKSVLVELVLIDTLNQKVAIRLSGPTSVVSPLLEYAKQEFGKHDVAQLQSEISLFDSDQGNDKLWFTMVVHQAQVKTSIIFYNVDWLLKEVAQQMADLYFKYMRGNIVFMKLADNSKRVGLKLQYEYLASPSTESELVE